MIISHIRDLVIVSVLSLLDGSGSPSNMEVGEISFSDIYVDLGSLFATNVDPHGPYANRHLLKWKMVQPSKPIQPMHLNSSGVTHVS